MTRALVLLCALTACEVPDSMRRQRKLLPYRTSPLFADNMGMRAPPTGTVPREQSSEDPPATLTRELLDLGQRSFDRTCAACHGRAGDGDSVVASKMCLRRPPTLLDEPKRTRPAAELYSVIRDGYGLMPNYQTQLTPHERWATVAYIRALQLSQQVPASELPAGLRAQLDRGAP